MNQSNVAVVVPSIRPESLEQFRRAWEDLFNKHNVFLVVVLDGEDPVVQSRLYGQKWLQELPENKPHRLSHFPPAWSDVVFNFTDSVRNLGFLYLADMVRMNSSCTHLDPERWVVITLDDDVRPWQGNDPIQEHLDALQMKVPISWMSTASEYMRGFPYGVRHEAQVWVSHGVWEGVHDYDGPTQLVNGNTPATFYKGPVPKGCLFPCCGMNLAFNMAALPYVYFAPMGPRVGIHRFGDIWMGVLLKRKMDSMNKAVVTGHSTIHHLRASDALTNLIQESTGLKMNEEWWKGQDANLNEKQEIYFREHGERARAWRELIRGTLSTAPV